MESFTDFSDYRPTDGNTGPDGPLTPVQAYRTCVHDYAYDGRLNDHIGEEITSQIQSALEKFDYAFTKEQDDALLDHLWEMRVKFEVAALTGINFVRREIEQEFSDFFEALISSRTAKTV